MIAEFFIYVLYSNWEKLEKQWLCLIVIDVVLHILILPLVYCWTWNIPGILSYKQFEMFSCISEHLNFWFDNFCYSSTIVIISETVVEQRQSWSFNCAFYVFVDLYNTEKIIWIMTSIYIGWLPLPWKTCWYGSIIITR